MGYSQLITFVLFDVDDKALPSAKAYIYLHVIFKHVYTYIHVHIIKHKGLLNRFNYTLSKM